MILAFAIRDTFIGVGAGCLAISLSAYIRTLGAELRLRHLLTAADLAAHDGVLLRHGLVFGLGIALLNAAGQ